MLLRTDIAEHGPLHCVLVDEAQFLSKPQVWQLSEVVDALRVPVLCYGLRTDFRGELFEGSQYLLAWADELQEIKTICHSGKKATMNVRIDDDGRALQAGPQVEIGGNERYVSVSRAEFKKIMFDDGTRGEGGIAPLQRPLPLLARLAAGCVDLRKPRAVIAPTFRQRQLPAQAPRSAPADSLRPGGAVAPGRVGSRAATPALRVSMSPSPGCA